MDKMKNKLPAMRFPEFKGEWERKRIGEITYRISDPVNVEKEKLYQQIGIRSHGKGIFHKELVTGKSLGNKRVFWVKKDMFIVNIVFAWEQAIAKTTKAELGMIASHRFPMYQPVIEGLNLEFIHYFFLTLRGKYLLGIASPGGAGRNKTLGQKEFERLMIILPGYREQQKIADFLTAVDDKINQLTRKKTLLEQYKKGVMQKIFSQEIRFKDDEGKEFPEWETVKIHDFAPLQRGFDLPVSEIKKGNYPVVFSNGILKTHNIYKVKAPGVVTGRSGTIGKVTFVEKDFWPHNTSLWVTDFKNNFPKFVYYFYDKFKLDRLGTGSGIPTLNRNDVHVKKIRIPHNSEQKKIADFLTGIDKKIEQVNTQLEKTKEWKRGLLQQMFV